MKKAILTSVLVFSVILNSAGFASAAINEVSTEQDVLIMYKNDIGKEAILDEVAEVDYEFETIPVVSATVTNRDLRELLTDPNIAYIEPDFPVYIADYDEDTSKYIETLTPTNTEKGYWNYNAIHPSVMWNEGITGKGVSVAVIDTGIYPHEELNIAGGVSTIGGKLDYSKYIDDEGHGTHVAGIIAAQVGNDGTFGIAPDVELYAVKALGSDGSGYASDVMKGIEWCIDNDIDIINLSLGSSNYSAAYEQMVKNAYNSGIVLVGAAGNEQEDYDIEHSTMIYPAKYEEVIAVAAIDRNYERGYFSSTGEEVELAAPGVSIYSTSLNGGYKYSSGTSQATPHISGIIALLMQKYPEMTNRQLREEIKKYAVDIGQKGRDIEYGFGAVTFKQDVIVQTNVTNLHASSRTEDSIQLKWFNPTNEDFKTNNIYLDGILVGSTAEETYEFTGLEANTFYSVMIKSVDESGNKSSGKTITVSTDITPPGDVTNLTVSELTTTSVDFTWTNPTDEDFDKVKLYQNGMLIDEVTGNSYIFENLIPNYQYEFTFVVVDTSGNRSKGESRTIRTDITPPGEIINLTIDEVTSTCGIKLPC